MLVIFNTNGPGVTTDAFNGANSQHCANTLALIRLLVDKGLVEPAEWHAYQCRALADVDQAFAEHRDDCIREIAGSLPGDPDG